MTKKETTFIFVNTLPEPYYDKMIGNTMQNFTKMVWSGELIEHGIKNKKIEGKLNPHLQKRPPQLKRKRETPIPFSPTTNLRDMLYMPVNLPILQVTYHMFRL